MTDLTCPYCNEPYPSEAILLRHRQEDHAEEVAAEGSAIRAAEETVATAEGRYTNDGFPRRTGAKQAPPTDPASLLGGLFPSADPGAALSPWDRELQDREGP